MSEDHDDIIDMLVHEGGYNIHIDGTKYTFDYHHVTFTIDAPDLDTAKVNFQQAIGQVPV